MCRHLTMHPCDAGFGEPRCTVRPRAHRAEGCGGRSQVHEPGRRTIHKRLTLSRPLSGRAPTIVATGNLLEEKATTGGCANTAADQHRSHRRCDLVCVTGREQLCVEPYPQREPGAPASRRAKACELRRQVRCRDQVCAGRSAHPYCDQICVPLGVGGLWKRHGMREEPGHGAYRPTASDIRAASARPPVPSRLRRIPGATRYA